MTDAATEIVRGRVGSCTAALRSTIIFTTCDVAVSERWKGTGQQKIRVSVPGGRVNGRRQSYGGAPTLKTGDEHVFFLWAGPSGITQVMGLSQGLFTLEKTQQGAIIAVRAPVRERMIDYATGKAVWDEGVEMPLDELRAAVRGKAKE